MTSRRFIALFVALLFAATPVLAQSPASEADQPPVWKQTFDAQMSALLKSDDVAVQDRAMVNIITVASRQDPDVKINRVVAPLLSIFENANAEQRRLLALSALHATNSDAAMRSLIGMLEVEPSDLLQERMRAFIADYQAKKKAGR
jgi:hypothetical protein